MDRAVKRYKLRRDARIKKRLDGNTRLPFGLCQREGIEIGEDWSPQDAWEALAGKGISPEGEYAKLNGRKTTLKSSSGAEYSNLKADKFRDRYILRGDFDDYEFGGGKKRTTGAKIAEFISKDEMMAYLQEKGVNHFKDPDTGETVNPIEMKLPKTVAKKGERRYTDLVLGLVRDRSGPFSGAGFTLTGKDFLGRKDKVGTFKSVEVAKKYAEEKLGCKPGDLRQTRDIKAFIEAGTPIKWWKS